MYDFTNVDPVKCCTWLVLPSVYDECLSYGEQLNKFCKALNDLIENNNNIPQYVAEMIQNYITSGAIDQVVRNILANYILNVKYPPKGVTPAVGDGSADDTDAIQGCIDYAFNQGGGCVYFPYGKYLTRSLTLRSGVSLVGFDRYSTRIVQRGGDTKPLVSGENVQNVQISNLTLDGNNEVQTDDLDVVNILGKDVLLYNLVVKSGYQCLVYNGLGGDLQVSNVVFGGAVKKVAVINGKDSVQFKNVKFNELGRIQGECVLEVGSNDGVYSFSSKAVTPVCIKCVGNRNNFIADIINSTNNFVDTGSMNNFNVLGVEVKEQLAQGKNISIAGNTTENITGSKTETVGTGKVENITGTKTEVISENKSENITGNREIAVGGTDSIRVDGVSSVNIGDARTEIYGNSRNVDVTSFNTEEYHDTMTENFDGNHIVNGTNETNTFTGKVINKSKDFELVTTNPLTYSHNPVHIDDNFDGIPFKDSNNNEYNVLVYKKSIEKMNTTKIGYNGSFMTNSDLTNNYIYAQGGTYLDGYYYQFLFDDTKTKQIIYKINANSGTYTYKEFTNLYHGNGMTNDESNLYITAWGETATAPYKIYKLDTSLNIIEVYNIDLPLVNIGYDKVTKTMYGSTGTDMYELTLAPTVTYKLLFSITDYYKNYTVQGLCVNNGIFYYAYSAPESILKINIDGTNAELIILDSIVNNLFQLGEMEDLEYVDGRLYTFSYNRSNMSLTQNTPVLLVFGNIGLNNNTIFESIDPRRDTIFVGNATSLKCIGSQSNPFYDTQQAVFACQAMNSVFPIYYDIKVNDIDRIYNGFYVVGNCIRSITRISGKPKIKFLRTRNANLYIENFTVSGSITTTENILIENSLVCLNTIDPSSIDILADRCFISGNYSFVSLIGVMGTTQNSAYKAGKVVYSGLTGTFRAYPKTTAYIHGSGAPNGMLGVEVASNISVNTTDTLLNWNRIMPNNVSLAKYSVFLFIINGVGYTVSSTCSLTIDKNTIISIKFNNGRFTLSATNNITISSIIAVR